MTSSISLYARVSSERQAQTRTIDSQIAALEKRIIEDGGTLLKDNHYVDNGYSGATLIRPGLEKLRDNISGGKIDKLYVHSPDRLSRKYAYQMILLEEFQNLGVEVIFLNCETTENPESQLLLQMQGMIAEYERAKIMERHRRGKIHSAKRGSVNVLSTAPFGYRYIDKHTGGGEASLVIIESEAETVSKIFSWIGRDRLSIGEVCRRLDSAEILTQKGKKNWDRSVIWAMLKNPAYKGKAAFGKTKSGKILPRIRPQKRSSEQPKKNYSTLQVEKKDWITIAVPAIVEEALFEVVQEQLEENRKAARTRRRGASYLLQGLVMCPRCKHAFYGKPVRNKRGEKVIHYAYYRCIGTDAYRFGGQRICDNKQVRTDTLEAAVWEEVKHLLKRPEHIIEEYQKRLSGLSDKPEHREHKELEKQCGKIGKAINRLIDSYAEGYINKSEFEPRVTSLKSRLEKLENQRKLEVDQQQLENELQGIVNSLEQFAEQIKSTLNEDINWEVKRSIVRMLVKRVEIDAKEVNVVFRINPTPNLVDGVKDEQLKSLQDCCRGNLTHFIESHTTRS